MRIVFLVLRLACSSNVSTIGAMTRLDGFVKTWPKHLMHEGQFTDTGFVRAQLDGLLSWWATAGVDGAVSEDSVDWLRPPPPRAAPQERAAPPQGAARPKGGAAPPMPAAVWPDNMADFRAWLAQAPDLPEGRWPGRRFLPIGPDAAPRLMIVLAAPEADDAPVEAQHMRLLDAMLRAAGLGLDDCHIATLSLTAPPGGRLEADVIAPLLRRMRHHIGLVAPQRLMLVGDQTNRAFAPTNGMENNENLPFVNHMGGIVPCISILHPRLIVGQPSAKAEVWKSLRSLFGGREL